MSQEDGDIILSSLLKKLRPFQREAYDFCTKGVISTRHHYSSEQKNREETKSVVYRPDLLGKGRILLADEMGLGKSITSLAIMAHYRKEDWPLLILCPASLRHTWPAEIEKFIPSLPPSSVYVVTGFDDADFYENKAKRDKIQIVVATYSLLQTRSAAAKTLAQFKFKSVIADESHNLKTVSSQRTKLALPLLQQAKRLVLLSGTPALARPVELWTQINAIAPGFFESNYSNFTKKYCNARRGRFGWDVSGLSNAGELHSKLRQIMVRRLKADVLHELPPKQRTIVKIQIPKGDKRKECESVINELNETRKSIDELVGEAAEGANFDARRLLMQAYQASGVAKSAGVCEYLLDWLRGSGSQKVLIFAHHKAILDALEVAVAKEFKGTGHIRICGSVSSQERAARVRKFQTSSRIRVAILSMTAAGVGLTLTAATTVMFAELHWTPGVLAQAEDRCHRIGQRNAVNILYLICQDSKLSVDTQLWGMLGRKIGTLGRVVDGDKNASMNAKIAQDEGMSAGKGQSVQDELQSFFAETSPGEATSCKKPIPVKGTIMSFFKKQNESSAASKIKSTTGHHHQTEASSSKSPFFATKKHGEIVKWTCEACTFDNSRIRPNSGWLACAMCSSTYFENAGSTRSSSTSTVTPPSTGKNSSQETNASSSHKKSSQDDPIVLDDDDENDEDSGASQQMMPKTLWNTKQLVRLVNRGSPGEPIDLIDDNDGPLHLPCKRKKTNESDQVVILDDNDDQGKRQPLSFLTFSVSKNSGRITIHYSGSDESSLINFEVDQVVTKETADLILEAKIHRKSNSKVDGIQMRFDSKEIQKVVNFLDQTKLRAESSSSRLQSEIELFVSSYQGLREIEKKVMRESGKALSPYELKQATLRLMTMSCNVKNSTERYSGGAKESARKNMEEGTADATDMAILEGRLCAWCGGQLPTVSKLAGVFVTYCSRECSQQGRLKRGGMFASTRVREQVFALEGGVCQMCGIDSYALYNRICSLQPAERLNALCNANWSLPKTPKALERLLQDPKECDFWEADHIKAVSEGGGGCGLENLRTLCVPCHNKETEDLRARLKLSGKPGDNDDTGHQQDITTFFKKKRLK